MNIKKAQPHPSQGDVLEILVPEDQEGTELYDSPTPDSYDPHIIPSETAARKKREGENFKRLPKHPAGSESIDTTGGFVVDKEGLVDNFGIEPEIYYKTPGDLRGEVEQQTRAAGHVSELRQEAVRQDELRQEAVRQDELRQEAVRQDQLRQEAVRQDELRQEAVRQDELRQEAVRQDELRQEAVRQDELRQEAFRQDELRQEAVRQDELRQEAVRQDELRQEAVRQDELRQEAVRQDELRQEAVRQGELRQEAVRQGELRQEAVRQDELRQEAVRQDELRQELKQRGVGIFSSYETTEIALGDLKNTGFLMDRVSVVGRDINSHTEVTGSHISNRLVNVGNLDTNENKAEEAAKDGAIAGGTVGIFTGLLVGLGLVAIPGVGPVMLAGAAATAIASAISGGVIGAAAGSLAGGLVGLGMSEDRAKVYSERVANGDYLVMVEGSESDMALAESIFRNHHIHDWHIYDLPHKLVRTVTPSSTRYL
jgi:hypothetical protein